MSENEQQTRRANLVLSELTPFVSFRPHEREHVKRNFLILQKTYNKNLKRFDFAIYRLYKEHNFTPHGIHWVTEKLGCNMKYYTLTGIIGRVFAHLCRNDKSCVFAPYLPKNVRLRLHKGRHSG